MPIYHRHIVEYSFRVFWILIPALLVLSTGCEKSSEEDEAADEERTMLTSLRSCPAVGLTHGQKRSEGAFTEPSVPYGSSCDAIAVTHELSCRDGVSSSSLSINLYSSCFERLPESCAAAELAEGEAKSFPGFKQAIVSYGQSCSSVAGTRQLSCKNGSLEVKGAEYRYADCRMSPPVSCQSMNMAEDEVRKESGFSLSQVPSGQTCSSYEGERITSCEGGLVRVANPQFQFSSCKAADALNCSTAQLQDGEKREEELFSTEVVDVNGNHSCEDRRGKRVTSCENGVVDVTGEQFQFETCEPVDGISCIDGELQEGESKQALTFKKDKSALGYFCARQAKIQKISCENGRTVFSEEEFNQLSCRNVHQVQFWTYTNGRFNTPWDLQPGDGISGNPNAQSEKTNECLKVSRKKLQDTLNDSEVMDLLRRMVDLGATPRFVLMMSTMDQGPAENPFQGRDRDAYFWHWNQDGREPSIAMSRFDKGTWVWESSLAEGKCSHPDREEMLRYLRYAKSRLQLKDPR